MSETLEQGEGAPEQAAPAVATAEAGQQTAETVQPIGVSRTAAKESIPGGPLLIAAYMFIWVALFAYLLFVRRAQVRVEREVTELEERLDRHIGAIRSGGDAR